MEEAPLASYRGAFQKKPGKALTAGVLHSQQVNPSSPRVQRSVHGPGPHPHPWPLTFCGTLDSRPLL